MEFVEIKPASVVGGDGKPRDAYRLVWREHVEGAKRARRRQILAVRNDKETFGDVLRGFAAYVDANGK